MLASWVSNPFILAQGFHTQEQKPVEPEGELSDTLLCVSAFAHTCGLSYPFNCIIAQHSKTQAHTGVFVCGDSTMPQATKCTIQGQTIIQDQAKHSVYAWHMYLCLLPCARSRDAVTCTRIPNDPLTGQAPPSILLSYAMQTLPLPPGRWEKDQVRLAMNSFSESWCSIHDDSTDS